MDRVVQQNAANSEESASTSQELSAQAEHMKIAVNELVGVVGGGINESLGKQSLIGWFRNSPKQIEKGKHITSCDTDLLPARKTLLLPDKQIKSKANSSKQVVPHGGDFTEY
jgi:methyl-accepting chemotaxis protein